MKRMKKLFVCIMTMVLVLGICLPANVQSALAMSDEEYTQQLLQELIEQTKEENAKREQEFWERQKALRIDPEMLWTDGSYLLDGKGNLWKFKEYIDGRWSMEGKVEKVAENVFYAGNFVKTDGTLLSPDELWPADKKVKFSAYSAGSYAVVDEKGNLWVWGETYVGNLGCLENDGIVEKPKKIMSNVEKVYLFSAGGCAIKEDGTLWSWGSDGPLITDSHHDKTVWFNGGYTNVTSKPVKVMSNVKDVWWGSEYIILKEDNSLYAEKKKLDENVTDVFVTIGTSFKQTVMYVKEDGTLWGYGIPAALGLEKGNTSYKGEVFGSRNETETVSYQCVPVKLMENVAVIMNGEHSSLEDHIYIFKRDGSIVEISYKEMKEISPRFYMYLYYFDDETAELTAEQQKLKDGIEATTIKVKSALTSDGKIKLTWTKSKGYAVDYYEVYRSTNKTKAFNKQYVTSKGTQKSYKNTSVKKGTRYYYAVRGVREINGQKYYTQWSNLANRKVQ